MIHSKNLHTAVGYHALTSDTPPCPNFYIYKIKILAGSNFATIVIEQSVLKLFQLSNGDMLFS